MLPRVWRRAVHAPAAAQNVIRTQLKPLSAQCVTVTSWFFDRDLDMADFEPLARASALLLSPRGGGGALLLAAAHVTHPHRRAWLYPGAPDFLSSLRDEHVRLTVEVRGADGGVLARARAARAAPHASRDVSLVRLAGAEAGGGTAWARAAAAAGVRACALSAAAPAAGARLRVLGHASTGALLAADGAEAPMPPLSLAGTFLGRSGSAQSFARTERPCELGMCGGPVVLADGGDSGAADLHCIGMLEGVVTPPPPGPLAAANALTPEQAAKRRAAEVLAGAAVFIDAGELLDFIRGEGGEYR
jgi:hypothetical protein